MMNAIERVELAGRRLTLYTAGLSLFLNLSVLAVPIYMMQVYQRAIPARSVETAVGLTVIVVVTTALYVLFEFSRSYAFQKMSRYTAEVLSPFVVGSSMRDSLEGRVKEGPRGLQDLNDLRQFLSTGALSAPLDALWSPIFILVLFLLHPLYGLLAIGSLIVVILVNVVGDRLSRAAIKRVNAAAQVHTSDVGRALRHAELIEGMGMARALSNRWADSHATMVRTAEEVGIRGGAMSAINKGVGQLVQIATLLVGAYLAINNEIHAGTLFVAMVLERRAVAPFVSLSETSRQWVTAGAAWAGIKKRLESTSTERQTMPTTASGGGLEVRQLSYVPTGRDVPVLVNISFELKRGQVLGIVGPSGSGKSTLARALVGTIKPTRGGVFFDGTSTYLWERSSFGRIVGYLPQQVSIMDGTVKDNIARMQDADSSAVLAAARAAGVHGLIGKLPFGYDTAVTDTTALLSGGQMQRIALARALFGDPQLLVLDEPNSNLDVDGERALMDAIEAAKARGAVVVLIAHRPSLMSCADEIIVLHDGGIVQRGPRTDVVQTLTADLRPANKTRGAAVRAISNQVDRS